MIDQNAQGISKENQHTSEMVDEIPNIHKKNNRKRKSHKSRKNSRKRKEKSVHDVIDDQQQYIENKKCEICTKSQNEQTLLLCDRCDDSYHSYCLKTPLFTVPDKTWICDACNEQLQYLQQCRKRQARNRVIEIECYACKQSLSAFPSIKGRTKKQRPCQIELKTFNNIKCLYCKHTFHNFCFSQRKNSLNCWDCERSIRKSGPKCHDDFMSWIQANNKSIEASQCKYAPIQNLQEDDSQERYRNYRLKVPSYMTTWQSIAQNQASIYYSFKTKGLTFLDDQLYQKNEFEKMMKLNRPDRDINGKVLRLHPSDQSTYQLFKINSKKGYVGPFQVKEDRVKGFYLIASEFIQPMTIVSQYVGEVKNERVALDYQDNDSIFLLVRSSRSIESLDIVPQLYGNISRFFLGINNDYKRQYGSSKLENVKCMRFSYKGRVRLLLYTSKPIQAGETLYFNYNGSNYEYPTQHFIT